MLPKFWRIGMNNSARNLDMRLAFVYLSIKYMKNIFENREVL